MNCKLQTEQISPSALTRRFELVTGHGMGT